ATKAEADARDAWAEIGQRSEISQPLDLEAARRQSNATLKAAEISQTATQAVKDAADAAQRADEAQRREHQALLDVAAAAERLRRATQGLDEARQHERRTLDEANHLAESSAARQRESDNAEAAAQVATKSATDARRRELPSLVTQTNRAFTELR